MIKQSYKYATSNGLLPMPKNVACGVLAVIGKISSNNRAKFLFRLFFLIVFCQTVSAGDKTYVFDIPPQRADGALTTLGEQASISVLFHYDSVSQFQAQRLKGEYSLSDAVEILLQKTGLYFEFDKDGHLIIKLRDDQVRGNVNKNKNVLSTLISFFLGASAAVSADNAQITGGSSQSDFSLELEEIVVTATKRSENLQDVPIAVTAFGKDQIDLLRSNNLQDLSGFVPNMYMPPAGNNNDVAISLRGIGNGVSRSSGKSVGVYVDGVYMGAGTALNMSMMDVESVEVLKGPQGTLFGRDTIGGAINITTQKPDNEFSAQAEIEKGNYGFYKVQAGASVPLVEDVLAMRISGQKIYSDGYIKNEQSSRKKDSEDTVSARVQFFYTPTDSFDLRLAYTHLRSDNRPNAAGESVTNLFSDQEPYTINVDAQEEAEQDLDNVALTIEYAFDSGLTLTSITGWSDISDFYTLDADFTPLSLMVQEYLGETEEVSQELRLTSPSHEKYDYLIGLYYLKSENNLLDSFPVLGNAYLSSFGFPDEVLPAIDILDGQRRDFTSESLAIFTHLNYHLTDELTIFGGLRYTSDEKEVDYALFGEVFSFFEINPVEKKSNTKDEPISWTLGTRYNFSDDIMVYTSAARGFRSSSIKDYFVTTADAQSDDGFFTKPEFVTNYELGLKLTGLDGSLQANIAAFYMDYTDIQVSVQQTETAFIRTLTNAAEASVKGIEMDLAARLTSNLRVSASAGYVTPKYENFMPEPDVDLSGKKIAGTPERTFSTAVDYSLLLGSIGELLFHADYSYRSEVILSSLTQTSDFIKDSVKDVSHVNAWVAYERPEGDWRLTLWVRNLLDEDDVVGRDNFNSGFGPLIEHDTFVYQRPRTYGLSFGYQL
jgi:iron complex outermembrane recepter protein